MVTLQNLTTEQLRKAISIKEEIERLEDQLAGIMGDGGPVTGKRRGRPRKSMDETATIENTEALPKKSRKMSAAGRAKIAAAAKARWAKFREGKVEVAPKKRRKMSAAGRAKIAAAAKARWAKAKAAGKNGL